MYPVCCSKTIEWKVTGKKLSAVEEGKEKIMNCFFIKILHLFEQDTICNITHTNNLLIKWRDCPNYGSYQTPRIHEFWTCSKMPFVFYQISEKLPHSLYFYQKVLQQRHLSLCHFCMFSPFNGKVGATTFMLKFWKLCSLKLSRFLESHEIVL